MTPGSSPPVPRQRGDRRLHVDHRPGAVPDPARSAAHLRAQPRARSLGQRIARFARLGVNVPGRPRMNTARRGRYECRSLCAMTEDPLVEPVETKGPGGSTRLDASPGQTTSPSRCGCAGRSANGCWREGVEPYPRHGAAHATSSRDVVAQYDAEELGPDHHTGDQVAVTGRVIFLRNTGKLCFARLREGDGTELQAMFSLADVGRGVARGLQGAGRPRRPHRGRRARSSPAGAASCRPGRHLADGRQGAASAAQRAPAAHRRGAGAAALRRHDRPARSARDRPRRRRRCCASLRDTLRRPRVTSRSRRRSCSSPTAARRAAVPHPPQCVRPGHAAADRAGARPEAGDGRRRRPGLRDRPHLPQRGPRLDARGGVLDARGLPGVRRLQHDGRPQPATCA